MKKIDGNKIAQQIIAELKEQAQPTKRLVAILVGNNESSKSFLKRKQNIAQELGVDFQLREFEQSITQEDLEGEIMRLSDDDSVGGIILQLPLPSHIDRSAVISRISLFKDVDNLTGEASVLSPAVSVIQDILKEVSFSLLDKTVAVVGSEGFLIGQPVVRWLGDQSLKISGLEIKAADIKTKDLRSFVQDADLVISGVGKKNLIDSNWLQEGVLVIDFGYPADLNLNSEQLSFYTPTPGGTGPILVAELFRNFYKLFSLR
tara:strand:- start:5520 stop:6302 length:783 start_codon:yes stop_codon:yes gene_type:complete